MYNTENIYKVYNLYNFKKNTMITDNLSNEDINAIEIVGNVLPFKVNNYVINELIDWKNIPDDPIFQLTFPQKGMLSDKNYKIMEDALKKGYSKDKIHSIANEIRFTLNPNPSDQKKSNVPEIDGIKLHGAQHKYVETVLFFPSNGQTCHAYCTFCFRWSQFVGIDELKFAMKETDVLIKYLNTKPLVTDLLFTGGDPMVMSSKFFEAYVTPFINKAVPHLKNIRIGTKSLSYWPYRFLTDKDSDDLLRLFERIVKSGLHLSIMAHFSHINEMKTKAVQEAVKRILNTGAQIRTQSPILNHINNSSEVWRDMWKEQVRMGMVPYYMFIARDTGARDYFAVTLEDSWKVFRDAYKEVSGIARTVRGPSMSTSPGKIHILGVSEIKGEKVFVLSFLQGRNPDWVGKPFFAEYNPNAIWLNDLKPAFGKDKFFFEK